MPTPSPTTDIKDQGSAGPVPFALNPWSPSAEETARALCVAAGRTGDELVAYQWLDGFEDDATMTLADAVVANIDDEEVVPLLLGLAPGESYTIGGGAAPALTVTRVLGDDPTNAPTPVVIVDLSEPCAVGPARCPGCGQPLTVDGDKVECGGEGEGICAMAALALAFAVADGSLVQGLAEYRESRWYEGNPTLPTLEAIERILAAFSTAGA